MRSLVVCLLMLIVGVIGQEMTMAPTTNVSIPLGATLRPTTPTVTMAPSMMEVVNNDKSSGEQDRIVSVLVNLSLMVALTVLGVYLIAYGDHDCDKMERKGLFKKIQTTESLY